LRWSKFAKTMGSFQILGHLCMPLTTPEEFVVGRFLVRIAVTRCDLPGVDGWMGTWSVHRLPLRLGQLPLKIGDTDYQPDGELALRMAKNMGTMTARSL